MSSGVHGIIHLLRQALPDYKITDLTSSLPFSLLSALFSLKERPKSVGVLIANSNNTELMSVMCGPIPNPSEVKYIVLHGVHTFGCHFSYTDEETTQTIKAWVKMDKDKK